MKRHCILILILLTAMASCRDLERDLYSPLDEGPYMADNYADLFKGVWGSLSETYVYWPWTTADWDSVYNAHYQAFKDQDNSGKRMAEEEFHERWSSVFGLLIDHHMVAQIRNPYSDSLHVFDVADMHRRARATFHEPMEADTTVLYKIGKTVYLRAAANCTTEQMNTLRTFLITDTATALIVDVRSTASNEKWLTGITGMLAGERIAYAAHCTKFSSSPLDLTQPVMSYMEPAAEQAQLRRIMCLTDMYSTGTAERLVMALRTLENHGFTVQTVGEQTCGAMGIDYPDTDSRFTTYYAGSFGDKDIAKHRQSTFYVHADAATTQDASSLECPEGIGIQPDKECPYNEALTTAVQMLQ